MSSIKDHNALTHFCQAKEPPSNSQNNDQLNYWERRSRKHGIRAVINLDHPQSDFDAITEYQKRILYPLFRAELSGNEVNILDLGCGPGRFTVDLARIVGGNAIGLDPIKTLLDLAQPEKGVEYMLGDATDIPLPANSMDVIWVCLVLGVIDDQQIRAAAREIERVLRQSGLLFFAECTSNLPRRPHMTYRSVVQYKRLFPAMQLRCLGGYDDLGQTISVFAGRKK